MSFAQLANRPCVTGVAQCHGLCDRRLDRRGEWEVHLGDEGGQDVLWKALPLLAAPPAQLHQRNLIEWSQRHSVASIIAACAQPPRVSFDATTAPRGPLCAWCQPVSYTHLTLPTKRIV